MFHVLVRAVTLASRYLIQSHGKFPFWRRLFWKTDTSLSLLRMRQITSDTSQPCWPDGTISRMVYESLRFGFDTFDDEASRFICSFEYGTWNESLIQCDFHCYSNSYPHACYQNENQLVVVTVVFLSRSFFWSQLIRENFVVSRFSFLNTHLSSAEYSRRQTQTLSLFKMHSFAFLWGSACVFVYFSFV